MKNYIFIVLGALYIGYFYLNGGDKYLVYVKDNIVYGDIMLSYFNGLLGYFVGVSIISIFNKGFEKLFIRLFGNNDYELDDIIGNFIVKFIDISKYVLGVYIFIYLAITPGYIDVMVDKFSSIILILIFLYFLTSFVNIVFQKQLIFKSKLKAVSKTLLPFVNKVVVIFIWIIGAITILGNLGYDVTALVAGAGIGGLAVALAAQKSITNVFGAITILLNKPFKVGDVVMIDNHIGTVKEIGLSYLTLKDKMGHQIMIPNETIISTSIENYSIRENRRTDFTLGLVYGTTLEKMKEGVQIIEGILEKYVEDKTIASYRVNFEMFSAYSLDISTTYFSLLNKEYLDYIKQKEEINLTIKEQFQKAGLSMAFPTQELILKKEG